MLTKLRPAVLCVPLALSFALTACGGDDDSSAVTLPSSGASSGASSVAAQETEPEGQPALTLAADGPGVCFDLIREQLDADTLVNSMDASFSSGQEIEPQLINPEETPAAGELTNCSVKYQDPDDANKLVEARVDLATRTLSDPAKLEISVMGDASKFNLADYLIPLSEVDTSRLPDVMAEQQAKLDETYSVHAWSHIRMTPPDAFSSDHLLRLDVVGRLASNDIVDNGLMELSVDGKQVVSERLVG